MSWFKKPAEWLSVSYEDEIVHTADNPYCSDPTCPCHQGDDSGAGMPVPWKALSNHCAWCGDPPNANGSHSICAEHAEQIAQQSADRRARRGR